MKIFIRGNGVAFSREELLGFVERGLRGPWYTAFRQLGDVASCQIMRVMDVSGRRVEYHGLVDIKPTRVGWRVIERLQGARLRGEPVQVRKWFERSGGGSGDRRRSRDILPYPRHSDRRAQLERRRMVRVQLLNDVPAAVRQLGASRRRMA